MQLWANKIKFSMMGICSIEVFWPNCQTVQKNTRFWAFTK